MEKEEKHSKCIASIKTLRHTALHQLSCRGPNIP